MAEPRREEERPAALESITATLSAEILDLQARELSELRTRAATLLTAASLIASFLGTAAIGVEGLGLVGTLALLAYIGSILTSLFILLPSNSIAFGLRGTSVYASFLRDGVDEPDALLRLASWRDWLWGRNRERIRLRTRAFYATSGLLIVQTALWAGQLGATV